ncbi:MAG TPA: hypothetical protein VGP24_06760, partial [Glaciihabitans sp.]|nr:hypothetical protein [Glaciihabitans sp.]
TNECDENGVCATPVEFILRQLAYSVGPSASTGGFFCLALALALRAHETFVRDRGAATASATATAGGEGVRDMTTPHVDDNADELSVIMPRTPTTPRRSRVAQTERDYSLFMPPNDGD